MLNANPPPRPPQDRGAQYLRTDRWFATTPTGESQTGLSSSPRLLFHMLLVNVEVVGGCHGDDVVQRVPGGVEDLPIKVQTVHADLILLPFPTCAHSARFEDRVRLAVLPGRFQGQVLTASPVDGPEEVVVGARHHDAADRQERPTSGFRTPRPPPGQSESR